MPPGCMVFTSLPSRVYILPVVLSEVTQLAAYTPYILYSASGYTGTLKGAVDASQYGEVVSDGLLRGAIAPQKRKDGYVLQDFGKGIMAGATHRQRRRALSRGMERKRLVLAVILLRILLGNKIKVGNL